MKKNLLLLFLSIVLISSAVYFVSDDNSDKITIKAKTILDISYGEDPFQKYDIYLPKNRSSKKTKVIVFVHGGGWTNGDKVNTGKFVDYLKKHHSNYAIVSINYRLANPNTPIIPAFPNQFLDIGFVLDHIETQKETYQILPEYGLIGSSAGSHLALMYDYVYDSQDRVKMVCSIVGPTDLTDETYAKNTRFNLYSNTLIDINAYPSNINFLEAISPVFHVSSKSSPTLLFYGDEDKLIPLSNGKRLEKALHKASVKNKLIVFKGGHGDYWSTDFKYELSEFISVNLPIEE